MIAADFAAQLRALAEVVIRVGVNLQPAQPLLITEPYDLQGVHPEAGPLVEIIKSVATGSDVTVIQSDPARLRALVATGDQRGFDALVSTHSRRLEQHLARGGAFLFLLGSQPQLMAGLPAERLSKFDQLKWRHLGPVIQRLVRGATQWTLVPAPSSPWAEAAFSDLPAADRLPALWETVFEALRVNGWNLASGQVQSASGGRAPPIELWSSHLAALAHQRDELNTARHHRIRYFGPGTDITFELPRSHAWCTAQLISKAGVPFVANLPSEEVFTAPHKDSASGKLRVARPIVHGGAVIEGVELEFRRGRVVAAQAQSGQEALRHLLATDSGAGRIGEVAIVWNVGGSLPPDSAPPPAWQNSGRLFHHTLLDENAAHHVALGEAYPFCSSALLPLALNHSQVHLDLPLDATFELS